MFKTTKDMFYKQFDFFCKLTGLREPCPLYFPSEREKNVSDFFFR